MWWIPKTAPATATYTYYVDDKEYDQQIVKVGDTLLQPAVPTAPEGQAFAGWYTADGKKFEDFGEVQAVSGNVNLYARFETAYYVFYLDREGKIIATPGICGWRVCTYRRGAAQRRRG